MQKTCNSIITCNEERILLLNKNGFDIFECKKCGHRFTPISDLEKHAEKVYSDAYFFDGKDGYPNYLEEKDILLKYGRRYAKIVSKYMKPGKVLDVGSAAGFILKGFQEAGWESFGVEPNDTMADYGRNNLNLNIQTGSLENMAGENEFDLVNLIQVVGHFYDLDKALSNVSRLLKKDGLVLVESWDRESWMAKIMGKNWHEYALPSVVHWFSDKTLEGIFNYYGFQLISQGRPAKRMNIKHGLSLMDGILPSFTFKKRMMNALNRSVGNYAIPYPPFDVKWYIFKKV